MLSISIRSYHTKVCSHQHDYHQVVLPVTGTIELSIEQNSELVIPRQCAFIRANQLHSFSADPKAQFIVADFSQIPSALASLPSPFFWVSEAFLLFNQFVYNQLENQNLPEILSPMSQLFYQLLSEQQPMVKVDKRIQQVINYLDGHLALKLNVTELADIACLSVSQFNLKFKQQVGVTCSHFLTNKRMEKAKSLLIHSDLPISHIANQVGFDELSSFSRRFSQHFGQPPSQFRND